MKRLLFIMSMVAFACTSFAQKVDLDKFNFNFQYRDLPQSPLAAEFRTFSVVVNASSAIKENYSDTGLEDAVNIQGWKKVPGKTGHVIVNVNLGDLIIT